MTNEEIIRRCLEAFKAMKTADAANLFLKHQKEKHQTWAGTGQHKLRKYMIGLLEEHMGLGA